MKYVIVMLAMAIGVLYAQPVADTVQLKDAVVTAQSVPADPSQSLYRVEVVPAAMFQRIGATHAAEVLSHLLFVDVSEATTLGGSVSMQGIDGPRIKIMVDGVPVVGRLKGNIDLRHLPLSEVERIEVIRGPVSAHYGTDAVGGVVNIITRQNRRAGLRGRAWGLYESVNAFNAGLAVGYGFGAHDVQISGSFHDFKGLSTDPEVARSLNWNPRNQLGGQVTYRYALSNALDAGYTGRYFQEMMQEFGEADPHGRIRDKDYYTSRMDHVLRVQGNVGKAHYVDGYVAHLSYQRFHDTWKVDPQTGDVTLDSRDTRAKNKVKYTHVGSRTQFAGRRNAPLHYAVGYQTEHETTEGGRIADGKKQYWTAAVFGGVDYASLQGWRVAPSMRLVYNTVHGLLVTPSFQASYRWAQRHRVIVSYARGFRSPSLKELYLDFRINAGPITYVIEGNKDLKPETSDHYELRYEYRGPIKGGFGGLSVEGFYNNVTDLIALSPMQNFHRHYINVENYQSVGGNLIGHYQRGDALTIKVGGGILGRYNKFSENEEAERFLFSPEAVVDVTYRLPVVHVLVSASYKYSGPRPGYVLNEQDEVVEAVVRDAIHRMDVSMSRKWWNDRIEVVCGIKNLFDVQNVESFSEVGQAHARDMVLWGRSYFVRTSFSF